MYPLASTVFRGVAGIRASSSSLGTSWLLDGLEVTLVGSLAAAEGEVCCHRELTLSTTRFSSDTTGDDKWTAGLFACDRDRRL
jgi:hypothetical protein